MSHFLKWYRWVNILSLDVVTGAVIFAYYFTTIFSVPVGSSSLIVLGLCVWIVYTADHLKDVYKLKIQATTDRHRFHQVHFKALSLLVVIFMLIVTALLFTMDWNLVIMGSILALLVLSYLISNHYMTFMKEIMGGLLYCAGVLLPTMVKQENILNLLLCPEVILFILLALTNLLLFSFYEMTEDVIESHQSFALYFGNATTILVTKALLALVCIILMVKWNTLQLISLLIFTSMTIMLMLITAFPNYFKQNDRYRYWGDLIFLFPAFTLLV